jgi:hypothetical protein
MLGGFGFLSIVSFNRWAVTGQIVRFRAQSFTSASHPRDRISFPAPSTASRPVAMSEVS